MAKKPIVWIGWEVTWDDDSSAEYLNVYVEVLYSGYKPEDVINRDPMMMKEIKEQLQRYKQEFYQDDWNFDYGGYDRDIDYQFRIQPFNNKKIKADVEAIYKKFKGRYCANCTAWLEASAVDC